MLELIVLKSRQAQRLGDARDVRYSIPRREARKIASDQLRDERAGSVAG
jgi:hypothetical protein